MSYVNLSLTRVAFVWLLQWPKTDFSSAMAQVMKWKIYSSLKILPRISVTYGTQRHADLLKGPISATKRSQVWFCDSRHDSHVAFESTAAAKYATLSRVNMQPVFDVLFFKIILTATAALFWHLRPSLRHNPVVQLSHWLRHVIHLTKSSTQASQCGFGL